MISISRRVTRLALLAVGLMPLSAAAQSFLDGKHVTVMISSAPGGGTDGTVRLIGRFLARHLPGEPVLVYQNMPGAGGINALNNFFQRAEPDGLTFFAGAGNELSPVTLQRTATVKYDPRRLNMFGGFANDSSFLLQRTDSAPRLGNPKAPAAVMAEIDGTRSGAQMALWGTEALHWNLRWVLGYTGTSDVLLALDRGEADMASTNSLVSVDALLASGKIGILAQTGLRSGGRLQRSTLAPQAPTLAELVDGKLTGQALAAFTEWQNETQLGKWYALPPGTPAEIVATYRTAFTAACADPEFLAAAAKLLRPDFKPVTTADLDGIVGIMVGTAPEILDLMLGLRKKYGL
jgi:tripartite-type tricarboxylate transporter receptor subunit TctC